MATMHLATSPPAAYASHANVRQIATAGILALAAALAANLAARFLAVVGLSISPVFPPLSPASVILWTVFSVVGATLVRALLVRSKQAAGMFFGAVLIALEAAFFLDLYLWAARTFPATSGAAVGALACLQAIVASLCIALLTMPSQADGKN